MPAEVETSAHDIVVVGASAGGIEALSEFVGSLPTDLPAAVFVVLHLPPGGTSLLAPILDRKSTLPVSNATDRAEIEDGHVYVAPPDCHLMLEDGRMRTVSGPKENGHRPAVDTLFRSAAEVYGPRVIGIVLSGTLDDGTVGLQLVKTNGGIAIAQDPDTALHPGMPTSAITYARPDLVLRPSAIAQALNELSHTPAETNGGTAEEVEMDPADEVKQHAEQHPQPGETTGFTCPECGGAIWESETNGVASYACRIGHRYGTESFDAEHADTVEAALWTALRLVEERIALMSRLAERFRTQETSAARFEASARDLEQHAVALRNILHDLPPLGREAVAPA